MLVFFYEIYEQKIVLVPILTLSVISPLILNNNKKRDNILWISNQFFKADTGAKGDAGTDLHHL